ncbi:MAG: HAMP domain-containing histidine kinase [Alphaproteobacteria bacterium]|nr:HAMP domain-containing histidine kinase [Alphaproteobacteria bacterium]
MQDLRRELTLRLLRTIARWIAPGYEVRAMADLAALRGQLRLTGIFFVTILLPGLLLAWTSLSSIQGEGLAVWDEVKRRGELAIATLSDEADETFLSFETATRQRLESGRSPVDAPAELSPHLLVAFRIDAQGRVAAPFDRRKVPPTQDHTLVLSPEWREALRQEHDDPTAAARLYHDLSLQSRGIRNRGQAAFAEGRALMRAGQGSAAEQVFADVVADYAHVRDLNGFRLGDLARLKRGELLLARDPEIGRGTLEALTDELISARWTIGLGGEAAVAARSLELLEDHAPKDWLASARGRLEEKTRLLFYAGQLQSQLDIVTAGGKALRVAPAEFSYQLIERTLWATTWWGEDFYAFALDADTIVAHIQDVAAQTVRTDPDLAAQVLSPQGAASPDALARRTLAPYLPGWSLLVSPSDPVGLDRAQLRKRAERVIVIVLSLVIIITGALLSVRLVSRQLDVAREKADFAANVSHELRSPITHIRLKGESLQFGLVEDDEDLQEHYDAIVRESERLSRLVDNVLDFASIERGAKRYTLRPADLGDTVRAAVESARYSMETRGMVMELDLPDGMPVVLHDPEAIAQVVQNLISNAAKYGKEGGWIGVRGHVGPEGVSVDISDRGIGIPPEEIEQIFDRFYRSSDPDARRRKGTGIGLTIVKYIMEAHNGSVSVRSTPRQGSTFTIHFPLKPPSPRS